MKSCTALLFHVIDVDLWSQWKVQLLVDEPLQPWVTASQHQVSSSERVQIKSIPVGPSVTHR